MEGLAIGLLAAYGVLCIGVRSWVHVRQTGESPFIGGRVSGVWTVVAYTLPFVLAIVAEDGHWVGRVVDSTALAAVGAALAVGAIALTLWAQLAMGGSWRVGIDEGAHTALVTTGPYRRVRNPIYTAMFAFTLGLTLVLPNVFSILGTVLVVVVVSVVVRRVEEPYLLREHGDEYARWKRTTGRFLPRLTTA